MGLCLLLLLFALARERLQRLLTRIVFRRGDPLAVVQELRSKAADPKEEPAYLSWALDHIARFMHSERIPTASEELAAELQSSNITAPALCTDLPALRKTLENLGVEAIVPLRFSGSEVLFLLLGRRRGGQPYLSEDLKHLGQFVAIVVDRVRTFRESELRRLAASAELRALQAQINPHFLFNALNTLYGLVPRQASAAREMVVSLADVFRYFLKNEETTIPLEEELRIVEAYLRIETLRLRRQIAPGNSGRFGSPAGPHPDSFDPAACRERREAWHRFENGGWVGAPRGARFRRGTGCAGGGHRTRLSTRWSGYEAGRRSGTPERGAPFETDLRTGCGFAD